MWVRSLRWNLMDNRGNGPPSPGNWAFCPTSSPLPLLMRFVALGTGAGSSTSGDGSSYTVTTVKDVSSVSMQYPQRDSATRTLGNLGYCKACLMPACLLNTLPPSTATPTHWSQMENVIRKLQMQYDFIMYWMGYFNSLIRTLFIFLKN